MMRLGLSVLFVSLAAACSGGESKPAPAPPPAPGSAAPPTWFRYVGCDDEIVKRCPSGYEDGCRDGRTAFFTCVREGSTADIACDQPAALTCAAGEVDSCLVEPRYGTHHICILAERRGGAHASTRR